MFEHFFNIYFCNSLVFYIFWSHIFHLFCIFSFPFRTKHTSHQLKMIDWWLQMNWTGHFQFFRAWRPWLFIKDALAVITEIVWGARFSIMYSTIYTDIICIVCKFTLRIQESCSFVWKNVFVNCLKYYNINIYTLTLCFYRRASFLRYNLNIDPYSIVWCPKLSKLQKGLYSTTTYNLQQRKACVTVV